MYAVGMERKGLHHLDPIKLDKFEKAPAHVNLKPFVSHEWWLQNILAVDMLRSHIFLHTLTTRLVWQSASIIVC